MNSTYWYVHGHWFRRQFVHLAPGVGAPSQRVLRRRQKSQARSDFLAYAAAAADVAAGAVETALDGPGDGSGLNSSIWMAKGAAAMARVQPAGTWELGERYGRLVVGLYTGKVGGGLVARRTSRLTTLIIGRVHANIKLNTRLLRTI